MKYIIFALYILFSAMYSNSQNKKNSELEGTWRTFGNIWTSMLSSGDFCHIISILSIKMDNLFIILIKLVQNQRKYSQLKEIIRLIW